MRVSLLLHSFLCGLLFSFAGLFFSVIMISPVKQVYHTKSVFSYKKILVLFFLVETIAIFFVIIGTSDAILTLTGLLSILVISMIAYSDLIFGRIPRYFIFFSGLMGIFLDVLQKQVGFRLAGGLFTFSIVYLLFWLGKYYLGKRIEQGRSYSGLGLGDVYASCALGFLFGFSRGLLAILFALIIALAYAFYQTVVRKERPFLKARIRLGPFFLMSTIVVVFLELLLN